VLRFCAKHAGELFIDVIALANAAQASRDLVADSTNVSPGMWGSHSRSTFSAAKASMTL
jgi:hypothetical protein